MKLEYELAFDKKTGQLLADQSCFGSEFVVLHNEEAFLVVKRLPGHVYMGQGRPQKYTPSKLLLLKVESVRDGCLICSKVKEVIPGHSFRSATRKLIEECKLMKE